MKMEESRKVYPSLDIAKFIMAMLILTQHTSNEWAHSVGLVHAFFGLGNFAVPFFFACSGFLFFQKLIKLSPNEQWAYYKKWSVRIWKMYFVWSLIYFCFVFIGWWQQGFPEEKILHYIHRSLVYSTYATIWFLPALWVGVSLCYWLRNHCSRWTIFAIVLFLLLTGNLFGSYTLLVTRSEVAAAINDFYMPIFTTWRNGVFNGAPYAAIGMLLAIRKPHPKHTWKSLLAMFFFCMAFLAEAFLITRWHLSSATDQAFMMAPAILFMLLFLILWDVKNRPLYTHLRNYSMLIFLGQRLFLTAVPGVLPGKVSESILSLPEPLIYLFFIVLVLAFSIIIEKLSEKYSFLKNLW